MSWKIGRFLATSDNSTAKVYNRDIFIYKAQYCNLLRLG
jgi:hypothetical protein